ncbi:2-polyprenyl-3-methyl-5-hydroxy-6-metoxy-1,4-benzoquinol methylase [Arthrobacter stackebrandtii]|uniref:2-polyprenyl-3-methyl-5-hydroxy-6-metoxy-1, 4-benzoquinol methylase n=1 Tax=Arthrobacter stackebrandtii TaxID=272161 RepID=A0ABS4YRG2_9MICC|nr:class I SAM-dependent methyltransferase [Arthrobacter stackebrandtii]MBP2411371.1 2-polyprenyl-3-methyl-5-hydroxy-6-metoxy-1,4-benzoquinol methylase [Arthrobacter stackebrandtii]PYH00357.1 methyltransferase [Arthrobacter stackebrandtii]
MPDPARRNFRHRLPDPAFLRAALLKERAADAVEEMDKPDADSAMLERTYAQFPLVNRVVSRWLSEYRHRIRPLLSPTRATTLLDIGCGGGDIPAALARWAARDGLELRITAIDPDPRAISFAGTRHSGSGVAFRQAHSSALTAAGEMFDVVISNHMLHHLTPEELAGLMADSALLARRLALHSDIARSPLAYALFAAGTAPFFPGSFIRRDGLTSIRRSYTAAELRAVLPPGWRVEAARPWRTLALFTPEAGHA